MESKVTTEVCTTTERATAVAERATAAAERVALSDKSNSASQA